MVRAIAEAMFAQDGEASAERLDAHVDDVDAYVSAASKTLRFGLRVALFVVRIAPLLFFVRARTIERLSIDERVAILTRLERSTLASLSLAFIGWRTVMTLLFYEHPSELAALGYSDRRERHKHLPLAPIPTESGVRLTGASDPPSEEKLEADSPNPREQEVA